jgi:hypothetical protein
MSKRALVVFKDDNGQYVHTNCYFKDEVTVSNINNTSQECTLATPKQATSIIEIPLNSAINIVGWCLMFIGIATIVLSAYSLFKSHTWIQSNLKRIKAKNEKLYSAPPLTTKITDKKIPLDLGK